MNNYSSLNRGQYDNLRVLEDLESYGGYRPPYEEGGYRAPTTQFDYSRFRLERPPVPPTYGPVQPMPPMPGPGMTQDFSRMPPPVIQGGPPQVFDPYPNIPGETVVAERMEAPRFLGQGVAQQEYMWGVKPFITVEKAVEVPQTIIKEHTRMVPKPEIVERIIEVPKVGYNERHVVAPPTTIHQEAIVEVPRVATEVREVHVPKLEVQERLIEIPRIEYREVIEYEDRIEYREVPVDKIVEVPEIEYHLHEVERYVPQTYVQEYFVDRYVEVPIQQVQEVERIEHVPITSVSMPYPGGPVGPPPSMGMMPMGSYRPPLPMQPMGSFGPQMPMPMPSMGSFRRPGVPFSGSMAAIQNQYANYDPMASMKRVATPPGSFVAPPAPPMMPMGSRPLGSGPLGSMNFGHPVPAF